MARQTISVLSGTVLAKRVSRSLRNRLALTTILAAAPFIGYGRQTYAACVGSPSPTFICSGANNTTQTINTDDADVSTVSGFSVVTAAGNAIEIKANGDLRFTDGNASTINGAVDGLYMYAVANSAGNDGAITINADSNITGVRNAITAYNFGSGSIDITFDGTATGVNHDGMEVFNSSAGEDLTIVTGAQSSVTGQVDGIAANNEGSGDLSITANGNVSGTTHDGIYGGNKGNDLTITQGANSTVTGAHVGIGAVNYGDGDVAIIANGTVYGNSADGIFVYNSTGSANATVTTGAQSYVYGSENGIDVENYGAGDLKIIANGKVTGQNYNGIHAINGSNGYNLTVETGANSDVYGYNNGIHAKNYGYGDLKVTANGQVTGQTGAGIYAYNSSNGYNLTVITGSGSDVYGYNDGIATRNYGYGDLTITANGAVTGEYGDGIYAYNSSNGYNVKVTTGSNSDVYGYNDGIDARNLGYGDLTVTANGKVTGEYGRGIYAFNSSSGYNLTVITGAGSDVYGYGDALQAKNYGYGDLTVTANGAVTSGYGDGIYAYNSSNGYDAKVTTGANSDIRGYGDGIDARNFGYGDLTITANGKVTGEYDRGIYAFNSSNGYNLTVTTGAGSDIYGYGDGIQARNYGYGDLTITANGAVTGQYGDGINASNSNNGYDLKITTGAGSDVYGYGDGIHAEAFGSGILSITVNGTATGYNGSGVFAINVGGDDTFIKVGSGGVAQGSYAGIYAYSGIGENIEITNDGLVRNYSGETFDQAIITRGGETTVNNNNRLIGTVYLSDYDDTLNNKGLWNPTNGSSYFGSGYDVVNNSGTLRAGDDPTVLEETFINAAEVFNNSGVVTLVDGQEGDFLQIGKVTDFVGQNGKLAVDAYLSPTGLSDLLIIGGDTSGSTNVVVNLTNPIGSTPNFDGIPVIEVFGATDEADFNLEGGVLNAGFFAWNLQLDGDTHELITVGLGAGSFEFAAGITGAEDIWHQTTGTLLQRQADLRALLAGTQVTPVADFAEPVEPTPVGHVTPGFWFKGVGGYLERDGDEANNVSTDRNQEIYGLFAGFDFGTENLRDQGDALMFGLFGGYITSDLDFDQTGTEWQYEGPSAGVYATYLNHAFYADAIVKADFLDVDIDASGIAPDADDVDTDVFNIGGQIDSGYKMPLDGGVFIEPQASLAVVHTEVDDIDDVFGGSVDFDDETSVRGRLGLRLGHELTTSDQVLYSADVTASVWQEFAGNNDVTVFAPLTPATDVSDDPSETYGDVSLGFSVISPEGWSSFIRANYQFSEDYEAIAGNAGVRYAW